MRTLFTRLLVPLLLAGGGRADLIIVGPIVGYATDASGSQLREIAGVPGAYTFLKPSLLPAGISHIRLAPRQAYALVDVNKTGGGILFQKENPARLVPIPGLMTSADWTAFSAGASTALLFSDAAQRLQLVTGLPSAARVTLDLDTSAYPESLQRGAINEDGSLVLVSSGTAVYRVRPAGTLQLLLSATEVRSMAVLGNGTDIAVADRDGTIQIIHNAAGTAVPQILASGLDGIGAIFPSVDGQKLFATGFGSSTVSSIDLNSGEVQSFGPGIPPERLEPLLNADTFLISARPGQPGWIFYRDDTGGKVLFIPALPPVVHKIGGAR